MLLQLSMALADEEIQFINPPAYDHNCPVCLQLLQDAYQTTCCGNHICHDCTQQIKAMPDVKCPKCRDVNFDANKDIFFSRQLLNMKVYCSYAMAGCNWTGELRNLEDHLKTTCKRGVTTCNYCNLEVNQSIENHLLICGEIVLDCPNICSDGKQKRKHMQTHLESSCPLRVIMPLSVDSNHNIPYVANDTTVLTVPVSFTMTKYSQYLQSEDVWYSPPFFTHNRGYKLCLRVRADNYKIGKLSVGLCVLKSENDDILQWPIYAEVVVSLCNWKSDGQNITNMIYLPGDYTCHRNFTEKMPLMGSGKYFVSHNELSDYVQYNSLRFRINKVTILPKPMVPQLPIWATNDSICHFTVPSFTSLCQKAKDSCFYSCPFYTSSKKYKLIVDVCPNGYGSGKGTHVSVYVSLMKGEHDEDLDWPFNGDVVISLINWGEDKNHLRKTFSFSDGLTVSTTNRVTGNKILAAEVWGFHKFIAHSNLHSKYARNNCLLIKVECAVDYTIYDGVPTWKQYLQATLSVHEFKLSQFSKRKQLNNDYCSSPFYSHFGGYKMQLKVTGKEEPYSLGVFVKLMKGPNDDTLAWPFCGDIVIELLSWRSDNGHYRKIIQLSANVATNNTCDLVIIGECSNDCWGLPKFVQLSVLEGDGSYVQNDCLYFRVKEVVVYSTPNIQQPQWQNPRTISPYLEFTLTNFTKRCELCTTYTSDSFATHNGGYKLKLEVKPHRPDVESCHHVALYASIICQFIER